MSSVGLVLHQLEIFAVLIVVGVVAIKSHALDEQYLSSLSKLIMRLILPMMIFTKVTNGSTREDMIASGGEVIAATIAMYILVFITGYLLRRAFSLHGNYGRVFWAATMFGNVGFIGMPLLLGVLPERGMLYMALFSIIDQIMLWSVGIYLTLPAEKTAGHSLVENLRNVLNPAMLAIVLAISFITLGWKLPQTINQALTAIGDATTPLSLIYIGGSFCLYDVKQFVSKLEYYAIVVVKMIFVPVLLYYVLSFLHFRNEVAIFITLLTGMPSMAAIAMFARVNGSSEECALGAIMVTTISCLVTLPLVAYLANF